MIQLMNYSMEYEYKEFDEIQNLSQLILLEREKRLNLTRELMFERSKINQLEVFIDNLLDSKENKTDLCKKAENLDDTIIVGTYSMSIRKKKIRNYKIKVKKYRTRVKISRSFKGRSIAAKLKPRLNGKFAKGIHLHKEI